MHKLIEIFLLLKVVIYHEDTSLLVRPLQIAAEADLFTLSIASEEGEASRGVHHIDQALHREEQRVVMGLKLTETRCNAGLLLQMFVTLKLGELHLDKPLQQLLLSWLNRGWPRPF